MSDIHVEVKVISGEGSGSYKLKPGSKLQDLLGDLNKNPETVVVKRNDKIVPEDEELEDEDKVEIISVVSGG
uniref:Thiamine S n=1 Tax=uncultured organism TaxID=155900 RepID=M1PW92_9ZZZZ|nr:thiamine S [uncultured organism]